MFAVGVVSLSALLMLAPVASAAITSVTLGTPNGGENWSGTQNITWTQTGGVLGDNVSILLSKDSGVNYNTSVNSIVDITGLSYSWDTNNTAAGPLVDGNTYRIQIMDGTTGLASSGADFTVDNTPPTFVINDGTATGPVKNDTIKVTVSDGTVGSGVNASTLEYGFSTNSTCDSNDTYGIAFNSGQNFTIAGDHTDYLCVKATDNAGNVGYQQVGQLNTDNTAPQLDSTTPYTLNTVQQTVYFNPALSTTPTVAIGMNANEPVT